MSIAANSHHIIFFFHFVNETLYYSSLKKIWVSMNWCKFYFDSSNFRVSCFVFQVCTVSHRKSIRISISFCGLQFFLWVSKCGTMYNVLMHLPSGKLTAHVWMTLATTTKKMNRKPIKNTKSIDKVKTSNMKKL